MALAPKCHLNRGSQADYRWNPPGSFGTPGPGFLARCLLALIWVISGAFQSSPRGSNTQRPLGADLDKGNQFPNHCVSRQSCRHGDSNEMFVCMWELPLLLAEPIFQRLATQWTQESLLDKQSPAGDGACSHAGTLVHHSCRDCLAQKMPTFTWGRINTNTSNPVIRTDNCILLIVLFHLRFTLMGDGKISPQATRSLLLC